MLFGRAPPKSADLISLHIYVNSFVNLNFGLGSAMSVLLLLFLLDHDGRPTCGSSASEVSAMRDSLAARLTRVAGLAILLVRRQAFPLYTVVISSIKPLKDVRGDFHWIPSEITFRPYVDIWDTIPLGRYFVNALVGLAVRDGVLGDDRDLRRLRDLPLPLPRPRRRST